MFRRFFFKKNVLYINLLVEILLKKNGISKCKNMHLLKVARALMFHANFLIIFGEMQSYQVVIWLIECLLEF